MDSPIVPEFKTLKHNTRFIYTLRISFKCGDKYIPMTFAFDSGAISEFHFTKEAQAILSAAGRIQKDKILLSVPGNDEMYEAHCVSNKSRTVNMLGLKFIQMFGFSVVDGEGKMDTQFEYF